MSFGGMIAEGAARQIGRVLLWVGVVSLVVGFLGGLGVRCSINIDSRAADHVPGSRNG